MLQRIHNPRSLWEQQFIKKNKIRQTSLPTSFILLHLHKCIYLGNVVKMVYGFLFISIPVVLVS